MRPTLEALTQDVDIRRQLFELTFESLAIAAGVSHHQLTLPIGQTVDLESTTRNCAGSAEDISIGSPWTYE